MVREKRDRRPADDAPLVGLLTDFGLRDPWVGQMRAAILRRVPDAPIVDVTHDVPPHRVEAAGWILASCLRRLPRESVWLCVVDPGVGTARAVLTLRIAGRTVVAPDNGLVDRVVAEYGAEACVAVDADRWRVPGGGTTFDGRDLFAPVGAALFAGTPLEGLGASLGPRPAAAPPTLEAGVAVESPVVWIDRFGNAILDVHRSRLPPPPFGLELAVGEHRVGRVRTDYAADDDAPFALFGSSGYLEVARRERSAAASLGLAVGDRVVVRVTSSDRRGDP